MIVGAITLPSGPVGTVLLVSSAGLNWMDVENGFGVGDLAGWRGNVVDGEEDARGPLRTVGGAALADLKRDAFFCGAGAIVSAGALRSTISPTGAAVLCFLTDEEETDFVGAEEISKLSENLTDFLADVVGD